MTSSISYGTQRFHSTQPPSSDQEQYIMDLRTALLEKEQQIQEYERNSTLLNSQLREKGSNQQQTKELIRLVSDHQQTIDRQNKKIASFSKRNEELEEETEALRNELHLLKTDCVTLGDAVGEERRGLRLISQENVKLKEEVASLQASLKQCKAEHEKDVSILTAHIKEREAQQLEREEARQSEQSEQDQKLQKMQKTYEAEIEMYSIEMERMREEFNTKMLSREVQMRELMEEKAGAIAAKLAEGQEARKRLESEFRDELRKSSEQVKQLQKQLNETKLQLRNQMDTAEEYKSLADMRKDEVMHKQREIDELQRDLRDKAKASSTDRAEASRAKEEQLRQTRQLKEMESTFNSEKKRMENELSEVKRELSKMREEARENHLQFEHRIQDTIFKQEYRRYIHSNASSTRQPTFCKSHPLVLGITIESSNPILTISISNE
ncbi:hypothetical protein BLNAU_15535 [Blattamonas nauphoetae]|uniref:Uncharacterized protein n=1 Tax=Blattamonas nauphoetae TaxID=2049346 RepID=A0ABQ9XAJ6_9EUKA|nr:hypothetical protein BLNAU_15535 [Blattamonas nauphoetae]